MGPKNYYNILEVTFNASTEQIREQYILLIQAWHPDKFSNPIQKKRAEEKTKDINEAFDILRNPEKRAEFNRELALNTRWGGVEQNRKNSAVNRAREEERERREREEKRRAQVKQQQEVDRLKNEQRARERKRAWTRIRKFIPAAVIVAAIALGLGSAFNYFYSQQSLELHYQAGVAAMSNQQWETARDEFNSVVSQDGNFRDTHALILQSYYLEGVNALKNQQWEAARSALNELISINGHYKDSQTLIMESYYQEGMTAVQEGNCGQASFLLDGLEKLQPGYKDYEKVYASSCGPLAVVNQFFSEYQYNNSAKIDALMSTQGVSNADTYCRGYVINCLISNYGKMGQLKNASVALLLENSTNAQVKLTTAWTKEDKACQDYQLEKENGLWRISYFNEPYSC